MEACSGAHHWARLFGDLGHAVRLMAPKFVAPYRLSGKRGKNDAAATVRREAAAGLEALPGWARLAVGDLLGEVRRLDERVVEHDRHLAHLAREDERARRLMRLSGVGETTATALLATVGNGHDFRCGRQFAAWLGLVPG